MKTIKVNGKSLDDYIEYIPYLKDDKVSIKEKITELLKVNSQCNDASTGGFLSKYISKQKGGDPKTLKEYLSIILNNYNIVVNNGDTPISTINLDDLFKSREKYLNKFNILLKSPNPEIINELISNIDDTDNLVNNADTWITEQTEYFQNPSPPHTLADTTKNFNNFFKAIKSSPVIIKILLVYFILGTIMFSVSLSNLGIYLRMKNMLIPSLIIIVLWVLSFNKIKNNEIR